MHSGLANNFCPDGICLDMYLFGSQVGYPVPVVLHVDGHLQDLSVFRSSRDVLVLYIVIILSSYPFFADGFYSIEF